VRVGEGEWARACWRRHACQDEQDRTRGGGGKGKGKGAARSCDGGVGVGEQHRERNARARIYERPEGHVRLVRQHKGEEKSRSRACVLVQQVDG
jgi:hypothetical protein